MFADIKKFPELWDHDITGMGFPHRAIQVAKLKEILETLPADARLIVNRVGELSVYSSPSNEDEYFLGEWLGYIGIGDETFNSSESEEADEDQEE